MLIDLTLGGGTMCSQATLAALYIGGVSWICRFIDFQTLKWLQTSANSDWHLFGGGGGLLLHQTSPTCPCEHVTIFLGNYPDWLC